MSDIICTFDADEVAQVSAGSIDTYDAATTYAVKIGGNVLSVIGAGSTGATAAALRALLQASEIAEFAEETWSGSGDDIIGTGNVAGVSFIAQLTATGGTGTVTDFADTTPCEGPEVVCANNFINALTGVRALPVDGDTLYLHNSDRPLKYKLDALAGVTLAARHFRGSYTGEVALPVYNETGEYFEYRPRHFQCGVDEDFIGQGSGDGSGLLLLDYDGSDAAIIVAQMASSNDPGGLAALQIRNTGTNATLEVQSGTVDVAPQDDDAAELLELTANGEAEVACSANVTHPTVNALGSAQVEIHAGATEINIQDQAKLTRHGDGVAATVSVLGTGATFNDLGSGDVTNVLVGDGATATAAASTVQKTWVNVTVAGDYTIDDSNHRVTFTNPIDPGTGSVLAGKLKLGNGRKILPGAP